MATKLKNLRITKVDFVDEGANPDANIVLVKRKDGGRTGAEHNTQNVSDTMTSHTSNAEPETTEMEGEETDMRIDKSKLTQRERDFLAAIEKKAGIPNEAPVSGDGTPSVEDGQESAPVEKAAPAAPVAASEAVPTPVTDTSSGEDFYKSLPPQFRQEFEALRKFRQDTEDAELRDIAGSYTIIGKTVDQLFPVLKRLKATSQEAYDAMISTLNDAKASVEKSGVFNEIGRTGNGTMERGGAVKEAEAKAAELMKSRKGLTRQQAIDQILRDDPELAKRYEEEE